MSRSLGREIIESLEEFADALVEGRATPRRFPARLVSLDLAPMPYTPRLVAEARNKLGLSQDLFAQFVGVSLRTLRSWERGATQPRDSACRLMDEVRRDPEYWRRRVSESLHSDTRPTSRRATRSGRRLVEKAS